jgi:RimJ/RimL family protein N-acetyltransferase
MKQLMLGHAFRYVDRVIFVIGEDNKRSRRAVEKIGAVLVESRPNEEGGPRVVYAMTRDVFQSRSDST